MAGTRLVWLMTASSSLQLQGSFPLPPSLRCQLRGSVLGSASRPAFTSAGPAVQLVRILSKQTSQGPTDGGGDRPGGGGDRPGGGAPARRSGGVGRVVRGVGPEVG